jgi:transposase
MELWAEIRRRVLGGELSKRTACREYEIHWDTLKKILSHVEPPGYRHRKPKPRPKIDPFLDKIYQILEADKQAPRKQRHTVIRIFERLRDEEGYTGSYTTVKVAVREWKQQHREVFLPLAHRPGEAQVDFGFADVVLAGETVKVAMFVMTLPYSDALFIQVFPRECTESFLEGHKRAFNFFQAVPTRISYDNSKIAVSKIVGSREREVTREFSRLKSHYLYQSHFCLVRRANEKGHVERLLDFARSRFLVPVPRVDTLAELNDRLLECCRKDLDRRLHGKSATKGELLAEERASMLALPKHEFDARRVLVAAASSLSLVRFDTNSYSVPVKYAHREITVIATVDEVRLVFEDRLIARHARHWSREQYSFDPVHYLALLERKPGGLDHARPLADWKLPECFQLLRRRQEDEPTGLGTREYIRVLRLLETASITELADAVDYALDIGITDADSIRVILEHRRESPVGLFSLDGHPHLKTVHVETTDPASYRSLLTLDAGGSS